MTAKVTVTEAQRTQAYQQAIGNFAATVRQAAPTAQQMAAQQLAAQRMTAPQPAQTTDPTPRAIKHELLSLLHARSNSGTVRLGDVSRAFDALVRDSRLSDR